MIKAQRVAEVCPYLSKSWIESIIARSSLTFWKHHYKITQLTEAPVVTSDLWPSSPPPVWQY